MQRGRGGPLTGPPERRCRPVDRPLEPPGVYACPGRALLRCVAGADGLLRFMFLDLRRRENLSRFLPRQVVDRVIESGETALLPVQREVTSLFSDIRGFTTLSETLPPRQVLALLDDYFGHMTQTVMASGGMVNKFLGDGMLACWGVPDHSDDHAEQAMRAALDMGT